MADLAPGDVFAGYRIEAVAGRGGMGVVYRATERALDRTVALKLITPALAGDPEFRARFTRESRAAASIEHPNVIPIFAAGSEQDVLFIAMRFVDGEDLRGLLRREGPLAPWRAVRIVAQVADALDAAHERGLVHRDVKPANVLLTAGGHAYLTDFGLTKRAGDATQASRGDGWVGTLGYTAPEQIRGERVDARADVYALGCLLYAAVTGRPPFDADSDEAVLYNHLHAEPPTTGGPFDPVVRRALAKDPAERYPSAGDLGRAALAATGEPVPDEPERTVARGPAAPARESETVASPGATAPTALAPPARRRRTAPLLALGAVLLVGAGAGAAVLARGGDDGGPARTASTVSPEPKPAPAARVVETVEVGPRPNALVVAGGLVWTTGFPQDRLRLVDAETGRRRPSIPIPAGTTSMAAGRGSVWVTNQRERTVTRFGVESRRRIGDPVAVAGQPVAVAVTEGAVWVGSRTGAGSGRQTQLLQKLDPRTGALLNTVLIERGVENIAVGAGAVWVTNRFANTVTRVNTRTGRQDLINVGREPEGVDVGGGYVWVANEGDGTVSRIDPDTNGEARIDVGLDPRGVAAGRRAVWVTGYAASQAQRLDPRDDGRPIGDPVRTDLNPFKLALSGDSVWLTAVGDGTVQRIDF
jgi:YVTN family beta-propeller protein